MGEEGRSAERGEERCRRVKREKETAEVFWIRRRTGRVEETAR